MTSPITRAIILDTNNYSIRVSFPSNTNKWNQYPISPSVHPVGNNTSLLIESSVQAHCTNNKQCVINSMNIELVDD